MIAIAVVVAASGVLRTSAAKPPQRDTADALAIPTRALMCRPNPPGLVTPGVVFVSLVEEPADSVTEGRTLTARFDSLGTPLSLVISMHERILSDQDQLIAIGVEFGSDTRGVRAVGNVDSLIGASGAPRVPPRREVLTQAELGRGRQLAEWIWRHRCGSARGEDRQ